MKAKCNSRDREGAAFWGGSSHYLLEAAFRYVRAHFFAKPAPQLVPVKSNDINHECVVNKRESDDYSCWK